MKYTAAMLCVCAQSADVAGFVAKAANCGLSLYDLVIDSDPLCVHFQIHRKDFPYLKYLASKRGDTLTIAGKSGKLWLLSWMRGRFLLCFGAFLLLIFSLWLPTRVLFVQVAGNHNIPTNQILQIADESGIHFGATRSALRSEKIKNRILEKLPQLQWVGVNTYGCVAVISVEERSVAQQQPYTVSSIAAARDGIIQQATALKGSLKCKVGQAVKQGEILISGYTEDSLVIRATQAEGEIYARTERSMSVCVPLFCLQREAAAEMQKNYGLIFGKKRINFSKDSGIYDTGCVKMYKAYYVMLPGGYQLPLALTCETIVDTVSTHITQTPEEAERTAKSFAREYLQNHMVAGSILSGRTECILTAEMLTLTGHYACVEMIGIPHSEEIIQ